MTIKVTNIRHFRKTKKGHLLEIPIRSQNISQLEGDIHRYLKKKGLHAKSNVGKKTLIIRNIKNKEGKKAPDFIYAQIREVIATGLEKRNMRAEITGGGN